MSQADNHDTRLQELLATDARADTASFYRRLSPEGLHRHYETVDEATALATVAAQALAGDPDGALRRLESVPVRHLQELHAAVIELCVAQERSHAVFAVGGPGSIH